MKPASLYRPLQPDETLYFLHIQKTAGTTFTAILDSYFENDEICPARILDDFLLINEGKRQSYRLYRGHFSYNLHLFLPPPLVYVTILRHPIERVISNIRHILRDPRHRDHNLAKSVDLETFVTHPQAQSEMSNLQTRMIAPPEGQMVFVGWTATRDDLELAKERLHEFPFFGLTEYFNQSTSLLAYAFGWMPVVNMDTLNAAPTSVRVEDYPQAVIDAIIELNQFDIELYEYALQLFHTRYNQMVSELLDHHYVTHHNDRVPAADEIISVDVSKRIPGWGWYAYEVGDRGGYRWTGPDPVSSLDLVLRKDTSYIVKFEVLSGISAEILDSLKLDIEGNPVALSVERLPSGGALFQGLVSSNLTSAVKVTRFSLRVDRTEKPVSLGLNDDPRSLGIAIASFKLEPILSLRSRIAMANPF